MNKKRILIADNCNDYVWLLVQFLSKRPDIEIIGAAYDGVQAIEMIRQTKPDVLLLDIIMPGIDGIEVLRQLQQEINEMKIIIISSIDIFQLMDNVAELRIDRYFIKPIDFNDILPAISENISQIHKG